jgi:hypothetical protein
MDMYSAAETAAGIPTYSTAEMYQGTALDMVVPFSGLEGVMQSR